MIRFENLKQLKNYLHTELTTASVNPIRFINVEPESNGRLKKIFDDLETAHMGLAEYCVGEDTFPNLRRLRADLQKDARNVFISGLSAFFRLTPARTRIEIKHFLNLYLCGDYSFRIFFRLNGMQNFFETIDEPKGVHCFLSLNTNTSTKCSLTIIQNPLRIRTGKEQVFGVQEYLRRSETVTNEHLILYTDNARHLRAEHFFEDTEVLTDAFDVLRRHFNLPRRLKKKYGSEQYWLELVAQVSKSGSFEKTFRQNFNVEEDTVNIFKNFGTLDKFKQWLLWLKVKDLPEEYASLCAQKSDSPAHFLSEVYELIFALTDDARFETLCEQRKKILSVMNCPPPPTFFKRIRHLKKESALKILTDSTHAERLLIFETLQKFTAAEFDTAQRILQKTFPLLAKYLSGATGTSHAEYFNRYRRLKVTDRLSDEFINEVTDLAHNSGKNLYVVETRNKIIAEEYTAESAIFFIDGLGAEYLNFFLPETSTEIISSRYSIGRCNLPSVTEVNKDFLAGRRVTMQDRSLDTLKHETLPYPENILSELTLLERLKEKIRLELSFHKKIIVCSDHGSSRLAVLVRNSPFDKIFPSDGRRVYKHGRFADSASTTNATKKFSTALEYDGLSIFADYSRFVQKGAPGNEIHGGASLEEALVPVITLEREEIV